MLFHKICVLAAAVAWTGASSLAADKFDSSRPPKTSASGRRVQTQDFGYAPPRAMYRVPTTHYVPRPRLGRAIVPSVDYYHPNSHYPDYNAPYHVYGIPTPEADARVNIPYRFESQGDALDRAFYPDHVNYTVGAKNWGSFFRTYTHGNNYPGPKPMIAY